MSKEPLRASQGHCCGFLLSFPSAPGKYLLPKRPILSMASLMALAPPAAPDESCALVTTAMGGH